jgi:hypothetical protein
VVADKRRLDRPPDEVIVWALTSLIGEIGPNMRMIALGYEPQNVTFRFYMSREPNEDDKEAAEIVCVNFESGHPTRLNSLNVEFVVTDEPFGKLDPLDFVLFCRRENS